MNRIRNLFFPAQPGPLSRWLNIGLLAGLLLLAGMTGCGGKGDSTVVSDGDGELSIALTDAEGDFVSYTVDVVSLTLTKANGTVVHTLPIKTRVDFAKYTDMTEFLTIATIPTGTYVKGTMVLDYSNAEIVVENASGEPVKVAADAIKDKDGNVISSMSMSVALEGKNHLTIVRGVPSHLNLDFDLKASNSVSFATGSAVITVQPYLLADVDVVHDKPHRVRGPLKDVQLDASKFQVYIRPFAHLIQSNAQAHFGVLNVHTSDTTIFEIDGVSYQGAAGLALLANTAQYSAVVAIGDVKHHPRRFDATQVYAGSSVPGGSMDVTLGSVVARSGDVLTVKGMTFLRNNGAITFNDTVQVTLADSTTVLKALKLGSFSKNDISVGQFVTVFGVLTEGEIRTLDASNGYARLEVSQLKATRVDNPAFVVNVSRINGRDIAQYNFAGTGTDAANDANPNSYEVNHGALDVSTIATGDTVRVRGHVTPFGEAPADFDAITVIELAPGK